MSISSTFGRMRSENKNSWKFFASFCNKINKIEIGTKKFNGLSGDSDGKPCDRYSGNEFLEIFL